LSSYHHLDLTVSSCPVFQTEVFYASHYTICTSHNFLQHSTCSERLTPSYSTVHALNVSHLPTAQYMLCTSHTFPQHSTCSAKLP